MRRLFLLAGCALSLLGCSDEELGPRVRDPGSGPSSGYYRVRIAEPGLDPATVTELRVGAVLAYDLAVEDEHVLHATVQGAPEPGPSAIVIEEAGRTRALPEPFVYQPPLDPRFSRLVAFGASLSQGVQNGVPTHHGGVMSPPAQLARQLGGYFPLPLLIHDFLPEMGADDIGPPPACSPPDVVAFVSETAFDVLPKLADGYHVARIDPDIEVHDVAVGGARIGTVVHGPDEGDFAANFVARLVYDPYNAGPVERSQLELIEALEPTLLVSTDLYYNDIGAALLTADVIDPSLMTSLESYEADLAVLVPRLAATGAEVFLANMPQPSLLPLTAEKRALMIARAVEEAKDNGQDEEAAAAQAAAEADLAIDAVNAHAAAFNERLEQAAAAFDNVHIVDLATPVGELAVTGLDVGGQLLTSQKLGGLLGFDGVHFTDTGYALLADVFVQAINERLGTTVPPVDLEAVLARDPGSPAAIAAAGLDVSLCER